MQNQNKASSLNASKVSEVSDSQVPSPVITPQLPRRQYSKTSSELPKPTTSKAAAEPLTITPISIRQPFTIPESYKYAPDADADRTSRYITSGITDLLDNADG